MNTETNHADRGIITDIKCKSGQYQICNFEHISTWSRPYFAGLSYGSA